MTTSGISSSFYSTFTAQLLISELEEAELYITKIIAYICSLSADALETVSEILTTDVCHFGHLWKHIKTTPAALVKTVKITRSFIRMQKESWKEYLAKTKHPLADKAIEVLSEGGKLIPLEGGSGGAYVIVDNLGQKRFIVKPVDEDIFCLNNRKKYGNPFMANFFRVRLNIPLYHGPQLEALSYRLAEKWGLGYLTPKVDLAVIKSDSFYDFTDSMESPGDEWGEPDREKFCSIQEYVPNSCSLYTISKWMLENGLSEEQIAAKLDQNDFESLCIFIWLTFDNDAHMGNILVYPKYVDPDHGIVYGFKKIDNGLTFPEENKGLSNSLMSFPNADIPLSPEAKALIESIDIDAVYQDMAALNLTYAFEAFKERVELLKELAQQDGITLREINHQLQLLGTAENKEAVA